MGGDNVSIGLTDSHKNGPAADWVSIGSLTPWERNPRNNDGAVDAVAKSITRFGFASPIIARRSDGVIIAGHTRFKAAQRLGLDKVLVRYLDLDPAEAAALAIADNKIGEIAEWDAAGLADVLRDLNAEEVDLGGLGFSDDELAGLLGEMAKEAGAGGEGGANEAPKIEGDSPYTRKIKLPLYEPKGEKPAISQLMDTTKTAALLTEIEAAGLPHDVAGFLKHAAQRHTSFNFRHIAEYYCHAPPDVQSLMERSGLVIIDFHAAIENGFVRLSERLGKLADIEADDA